MCVFVRELPGSPLEGELRTLDGWCIKMMKTARSGGAVRSLAAARMLATIDDMIAAGYGPHAIWAAYIQPADKYGLRRDAELARVSIELNGEPEYGWRRYMGPVVRHG